jgi:hypothetical protein
MKPNFLTKNIPFSKFVSEEVIARLITGWSLLCANGLSSINGAQGLIYSLAKLMPPGLSWHLHGLRGRQSDRTI